jgi:hypothetical protein
MYKISNGKLEEEMDALQKKMPTLYKKMKKMSKKTTSEFDFAGKKIFKIYAILNILYSRARESEPVSVCEDIYEMIVWCKIVVCDEDEMGCWCVIESYRDSYGKSVIVE